MSLPAISGATSDPVPAPPSSRRGVVVYDGQCPFCRSQIERIRRRDDLDSFEYVPRQDDGVARRFPRLLEGDFDTGMRLVLPDGRILVGADAVHGIARRLRGVRWIAWLYRVPVLHFMCRAVYAWVARNRMRLAPKCDAGCAVPASASASAPETRTERSGA